MEYYALTDIGKIREKNQDQAATAINLKDQVLGVVCDGMGGHRAGEIASHVVEEHVLTCFKANPLRGLIWASYPCGSSIYNPVGINARSRGCNVTSLSIFAFKSNPAEYSVAYSGSVWRDLFIILTFIDDNFIFILRFQTLLFNYIGRLSRFGKVQVNLTLLSLL
mgnify:CR=1 FL=1